MSELSERQAIHVRHLHRVIAPTHYRREAEHLLFKGASPAAVGRYLRSVSDPPWPDERWVVIVGELIGGGLWWIWAPRLAAPDADPAGAFDPR